MNSNYKSELSTALKIFSIDQIKVLRVACSSKHSVLSTNTGAVFAWGQNNYFQVNSRKEDIISSPFQLPFIEFIKDV